MAGTSIHDIAKKSGVSLSTVSRVLNNNSRVNEELRSKVLSVIKETRYMPNVSARSLRMGKKYRYQKTGNIGFVIPEESIGGFADPFYSSILNGIISQANDSDLALLCDTVKSDYSETVDLPKMLRERAVDGLVAAGPLNRVFVAQVQRMKIPLVLVESYLPGFEIDSILSDNFQGAYNAVKHLVDCGHGRIAMLRNPPDHETNADRFSGYRAALKDSGIEYDDKLVQMTDGSMEGGYNDMLTLLDRGKPFTALFANNDNAAIGAKSAAESRGLKVPEDISMVGFDNIILSSEVITNLTTVDVPKRDMGKAAVRRLQELLDGKNPQASKLMMSSRLVERKSVRKIS